MNLTPVYHHIQYLSISFYIFLTGYFWLFLKRGFSGCGHGFGGYDGIDWLGRFDGFSGFGGFSRFSGFDRFSGSGGFEGFDGFGRFGFLSAFRSLSLFLKRVLLLLLLLVAFSRVTEG